MKKWIVVFTVLALMLGVLGCGDKAAAELDGEGLVQALLDSAVFSQKLEELPSGKASSFYGVDASRLQGAILYHASGVSKEQIAVFHAVDETAAREIVEQLQQLLEGWIAADKDYAPAEVPKLEKAVLRQSGAWAVLVVANEPADAAHLVGEYI